MASNRGSGINPDPVELVLSRLRERGCHPRQSNSRPGQWSARCPSHGDRKASLSVGTGDDGRVLLKCHKSCSYEAIATALDIQPLDLHPRDHQGRRLTSVRYDKLWQAIDAQAKNLGGDHVATYHYVHADGLEAFVMARYHTAKGKEIRPFCRNRTGRWKVKAPEKNRPVYRLRELIQANRIFVFEGEKCTDLARDRLGLVATTSAFGAQNPNRTDWSPLAGKEVSIVPDCGEPGRAYARQVARSLANLDPAPSVKVVNLPGLEEGEDLEQWLERPPADRTRDQIIEAFESLVAASAGPPKYDGLPTAEQRAIDLIREVLADGMVASQELEDRVVAAGISRRTYDRARPKAGVRSKQIGRRHHSYLHVEPRAPTASRGNASKNTKPKANRKTQDATEVTSGRQHKSRPSGRQDAIQDAKPSNYVEKEKDPSLGNGTGLNPSETGLDPLRPDFSLHPPDPDATRLVGFHRDPKIEVLATDDRADEPGPVSALTPEPTAELVPASTAAPARDVEPDHLACSPEPSGAVGPERADKGVWTIEDMFRLASLIEDLHRDLKLWRKVESKAVGPGPDDEGIVKAMLRGYKPRKKTRGRRTIWDTIAVRHYEQFVRGIEDGTITEERVVRVLPVLFKTEEVYRDQLARAGDTRKLPRDVLARMRDLAFDEALEWAGLARLGRNHPDRCQPPAETAASLLDPSGSSGTSGFASNPTSSSDRSPAADSNHEGDTSGQADHARDRAVAEASDPDDGADDRCPVSAPVLELAAELTPARAPAPTPAPGPEPSPGPTPAPTTEPALPPPSWSELSSQRWGPDDPTPGILIDRSDRDRLRAVRESIPDPSAAAEREAIQAESRVESGLPAEAPDALSAPVWPGPALALYRLIRDHGEAASRPVRTPDGPGQLWQMFAARAGVVLDAAPGRVAFFDPSQITSARPPGEACAPATPVAPGQEAQGGRAGSPPGSGPS